MSAYIVDREHIKYLVSAAAAGREGRMSYYHNGKSTELRRDDQDSLTKAGQMLWDANIESIQALYPDCRENMNNAPGPVGETFIYAHGGGFKDGRDGFEAAQVFKAANCYEYQSCEADTWKDSEAKAFIDALTAKYIRMLPGYEAAEWGAPKPIVRKPVTFAAPVKKNVATPGFADLAKRVDWQKCQALICYAPNMYAFLLDLERYSGPAMEALAFIKGWMKGFKTKVNREGAELQKELAKYDNTKSKGRIGSNQEPPAARGQCGHDTGLPETPGNRSLEKF